VEIARNIAQIAALTQQCNISKFSILQTLVNNLKGKQQHV